MHEFIDAILILFLIYTAFIWLTLPYKVNEISESLDRVVKLLEEISKSGKGEE